ncbi:MAG: hypothetical protein KAR05_11100 [Candidatus Omnitrophica bacterium]|nr:hypothetical protein [Candidatus Omnitrophota bacterium]
MKVADVRELLKNKEVIEEINRHLWIESQKAGYSIGIEKATDEWLKMYAEGWMKYHTPEKYKAYKAKNKKGKEKRKKAAKVAKVVKAAKIKKKTGEKKTVKTKKK